MGVILSRCVRGNLLYSNRKLTLWRKITYYQERKENQLNILMSHFQCLRTTADLLSCFMLRKMCLRVEMIILRKEGNLKSRTNLRYSNEISITAK